MHDSVGTTDSPNRDLDAPPPMTIPGRLRHAFVKWLLQPLRKAVRLSIFRLRVGFVDTVWTALILLTGLIIECYALLEIIRGSPTRENDGQKR